MAEMGGEWIDVKAPVPERRWVILQPVVYRYMDQQFIDEFFATGRLMLSSFARFQQHPDEERGDVLEGKNLVVGTAGDLTVTAQVEMGGNSLVFCTSVHGEAALMQQFRSNGYFRIVDTHFFGRAIANRLTGCTDGLEGFCTYKDHHVVQKRLPLHVAAVFDRSEDNGGPDLEKASLAVMGIAGAEAFFSKRREFAHQGEYRLIWNMDRPIDQPVFVDCPEALQYCEKVTGAPVRAQWDLAKPGDPGWPPP